MLTVVVTGRNDGYGGGFLERLLRTSRLNAARVRKQQLAFELLLVEWNPVPDRPLAAAALVREIPEARAIVVPPELHAAYSLNPAMAFHEMAAKNVGIRHARGETIVVTNADVIFGDDVIRWLGSGWMSPRTLFRASRVDIAPDCPDEEVTDPRQRVQSGEGTHPTCSYLGAGGDFCAARRDVWHAVGGFDERTRFTTRAKDWQFFLSARARGMSVDYIGTVYHLDHGEGFRNTPDAVRNGDAAHFGAAWDIEFQVGTQPPREWGLGDATWREDPAVPRTVHAHAPLAPLRWRATEAQDRELWHWVRSRPRDATRASLMHAITAAAIAGRPLLIEPHDARAAVAATGLAAVAREQGVDVRVRWDWPEWCQLPAWVRIRSSASGSSRVLRATTGETGARLVEHDGAPTPTPQPALPWTSAVFNPLLANRLLRAWLQMQRAGWRRIAIYGGGSHTSSLLSMGVPGWLTIAAIVVTESGCGDAAGGRQLWDPASAGLADATPGTGSAIPIVPIRDLPRVECDGILLSSVTFEADMRRTATAYGWPVLPLYADDAPGLLAACRTDAAEEIRPQPDCTP